MVDMAPRIGYFSSDYVYLLLKISVAEESEFVSLGTCLCVS